MRQAVRVIVFAAAIAAGSSYGAMLAGMFALQRHLIYSTGDTGNLAGSGTLAIPGSERLTIETPDGERLAAWYRAPRSGAPVFLFFHGKGGSLERKTGRWSRIEKQGAGILAISYRGYPGSTGTPSETGLVTDARAAYDWLRARHPAPNIVIHGLSLGAGVAVQLAAQVEARALVLEAPFTALVDVAAERYPWLSVRWLMRDRFLSRELIGQVRMPLLIIHGDRDTVIPFHHSERLFARANDPKVFVRMAGSDHSTLPRDGLYDDIWRFLGS